MNSNDYEVMMELLRTRFCLTRTIQDYGIQDDQPLKQPEGRKLVGSNSGKMLERGNDWTDTVEWAVSNAASWANAAQKENAGGGQWSDVDGLHSMISLRVQNPVELMVDAGPDEMLQQQQTVTKAAANFCRYKTELCRPFEENGTCKYGEKCQFAHGRHELRSLVRHPKYKTDLCKTYHTTGLCPYGPRCHFVHNADERRMGEDNLRLIEHRKLLLHGQNAQLLAAVIATERMRLNGRSSSSSARQEAWNHQHQQQQQQIEEDDVTMRKRVMASLSLNHRGGGGASSSLTSCHSVSLTDVNPSSSPSSSLSSVFSDGISSSSSSPSHHHHQQPSSSSSSSSPTLSSSSSSSSSAAVLLSLLNGRSVDSFALQNTLDSRHGPPRRPPATSAELEEWPTTTTHSLPALAAAALLAKTLRQQQQQQQQQQPMTTTSLQGLSSSVQEMEAFANGLLPCDHNHNTVMIGDVARYFSI